MIRNKFNAILLGCCITAWTACDDDTVPANSLNQTDINFMQQASYGNLSEKSAGQIASSKSTTPAVQGFGQMMVTDHGMAQTELDSLGTRFNQQLPTTPDSAHLAMAAVLQTKSGHDFDTTYMGGQVMDHIKTIQLFQDEQNNGSNQMVKNYANKYLPTIQHHYTLADSIYKSLH